MSAGNLTVRAEIRLRNAKMIDARKKPGLSQMALAQALNVPLEHIAALEKMNYSRPATRRYAQRIAGFLDLPIEDVLPDGVEEALPSGLIIDREIKVSALLDYRDSFEKRMILPAPDAGAEISELSDQVTVALDTLPSRERAVIKLRYGIDDGYARTLAEVGRIQKCTRERVRQIEVKALAKLRHPIRLGHLDNIVDVEE